MDSPIRISKNNDWIIDYNKKRSMYRASFYYDNYFD